MNEDKFRGKGNDGRWIEGVSLRRIYYYIDETGMEHFFSYPLTKEELIANGYRFLRSEKIDHYHQEV